MNAGEIVSKAPWLLLIHQLPAKPAYARVKVWRRLQALGAVLVKNAVYALPSNEETQEDFAWLTREIDELGVRDGLGGRLDDGIANRMAGLLAIGSMAFRPALILSIDISA